MSPCRSEARVDTKCLLKSKVFVLLLPKVRKGAALYVSIPLQGALVWKPKAFLCREMECNSLFQNKNTNKRSSLPNRSLAWICLFTVFFKSRFLYTFACFGHGCFLCLKEKANTLLILWFQNSVAVLVCNRSEYTVCFLKSDQHFMKTCLTSPSLTYSVNPACVDISMGLRHYQSKRFQN